MDSLDLQVLAQARDWFAAGHQAFALLRPQRVCAAAAAGGRVEDDLIERLRHGERVEKPSLITYGVTKEEAARFGLPCGGNLRLAQEQLQDDMSITALSPPYAIAVYIR